MSEVKRIRDALEVPECDCEPTYYGEWVDEHGNLQRVKLTKSAGVSRRAFREHLNELGIPKDRKVGLYAERPMCEHILNADHDTPISEWAEFLTESFPKEYQEPAKKAEETVTWPGTKERVEIYRMRYQLGQNLWNEYDLNTETSDEFDIDHFGLSVERNRNGSLSRGGMQWIGEDCEHNNDT